MKKAKLANDGQFIKDYAENSQIELERQKREIKEYMILFHRDFIGTIEDIELRKKEQEKELEKIGGVNLYANYLIMMICQIKKLVLEKDIIGIPNLLIELESKLDEEKERLSQSKS